MSTSAFPTRWTARASRALLRLVGWRCVYAPVPGPKGVFMVYPHTSNWDFPIGMLFRQAVGAEATTVPYQGTGPAMTALLGGQVDLLCDQTTQTTQHIKAGSVKLYGVTTSSRLKTLPDAPTLDEQGLKGFQVVVWHGVYAPKGTPKEAIDKFGGALGAALKDAEVVTKLEELGAVIVPDAKLTPTGLRNWLVEETARYSPVIKAAGVFAD